MMSGLLWGRKEMKGDDPEWRGDELEEDQEPEGVGEGGAAESFGDGKGGQR